jgi:hypothetical protein
LAFIAVKKNKINIRTVVQLRAAEFAEGENRKLGTGTAVALPQFGVPMLKYTADTNLCDV